MEKKQIVINTLVFLKDLKNGVPQSKLMDWVKSLGIEIIEIRREFFKNISIETKNIGELSRKLNMNVFYSVPEPLYRNNHLRLKKIEEICNEAYRMNAKQIKFTIGDITTFNKDDFNRIRYFEDTYNLKITVENDQTKENGNVEKILWFLNEVRNSNYELGFTFDIGNWVFQNEDPLENAKLLHPFIKYIHLKDLDESKNTVPLGEGKIDWKAILGTLPKNVSLGLEYPCASIEQVENEIDKLLKYCFQ